LSFRDSFREITRRYPSDDETVTEGRALHDQFYAALARACRNGEPVHPFAYEQLVECLEMFARGAMTAADARARIDSFVTAR
jgi:hypothetical protein